MTTPIAAPVDARVAPSAGSDFAEILRDITRGGVAGALTGIVIAGLGGRLVMRLAAMLHEDAVGAVTENGNRIGDMTVVGTLGLAIGGLVFGVLAGTTWVIVSPWMPGRGLTRAVVTAPVAVGLGVPGLVQRTNPDFRILDRDPAVVTMLIALVGMMGFTIALVDDWLDRRLPHPSQDRERPARIYLGVALLGGILVLPMLVLELLTSDGYQAPIRAGMALLIVGLCTLGWWRLRLRGLPAPPRLLMWVGRLALLAATALGLLTALPHVRSAAGVL